MIDGATVLESPAEASAAASENKTRRRWVLALSPSSDTILRIATKRKTPVESVDQLALHEATSYSIEQRGLEVTAGWTLEGSAGQQRDLKVPLPRRAQITSVVADHRELSWKIARGSNSSSDRAVIVLPTEADRAPLQLVVSAWYPLVLDRPWQLPELRPEGVFWSSGKLELSIDAQFELKVLSPLDCTQIGATQIGPDASGPETYSLLENSPDAKLEVAISRRQPDAKINIGSSLVLADQDVSGRLVTEWNVSHSTLHRLSGEIAAGWNVETVETIPADAMAEWFIDRRGNHRRLEIQLTDAASPARKISVIVMGRLQRFSLAEPIPADTLRMVHWSGARVARHLLAFQSSEPFTIESVGDLPVLAARRSRMPIASYSIKPTKTAGSWTSLTRGKAPVCSFRSSAVRSRPKSRSMPAMPATSCGNNTTLRHNPR